jgi:hypothetical protein
MKIGFLSKDNVAVPPQFPDRACKSLQAARGVPQNTARGPLRSVGGLRGRQISPGGVAAICRGRRETELVRPKSCHPRSGLGSHTRRDRDCLAMGQTAVTLTRPKNRIENASE